MGKKIVLVVALLVLLPTLIFAKDVGSKIVLYPDKLYQDMDALYLISGRAYPSQSRPWTVSEAYKYLNEVDKSKLNENGLKIYEKVVARLKDLEPTFSVEDGLTLGLGLDVNFNMRTHTNSSYDLKGDWLDKTIPPLLRLNVGFGVTDHLFFQTEFNLMVSEYSDGDVTSPVPSFGVGALIKPGEKANYLTHSDYYSKVFETNLIDGKHRVDLYWPKNCYISSSFDHFNISLLRGRASLGNGKMGQLLLSGDNVNNLFRFTATTKYFKFDWINLFFQDERREQEMPLEKFKMQMVHRFEVRPLPYLTLSLSDSVMFSSSVVELGYLNPSYIFHNLYNRNVLNAIAFLEFSVTPLKGWSLYSDFVLDQAQSIGETDWEADAYGFIVGSEYDHVVKTGILKCYAEYAYTTPCLYRRDKVDFTTMIPHYAPNYTEVVEFSYIGFSYGPDSQVLELNFTYDSFRNFTLPLFMTLVRKGEMDFLTPHNTDGTNTSTSNISDKTPYGNIVSDKMILSFRPEVSLPYGFSLNASLAWIGKRKFDKKAESYLNHSSDFQFTFGVKYSI